MLLGWLQLQQVSTHGVGGQCSVRILRPWPYRAPTQPIMPKWQQAFFKNSRYQKKTGSRRESLLSCHPLQIHVRSRNMQHIGPCSMDSGLYLLPRGHGRSRGLPFHGVSEEHQCRSDMSHLASINVTLPFVRDHAMGYASQTGCLSWPDPAAGAFVFFLGGVYKKSTRSPLFKSELSPTSRLLDFSARLIRAFDLPSSMDCKAISLILLGDGDAGEPAVNVSSCSPASVAPGASKSQSILGALPVTAGYGANTVDV